MHPRWPPCGCNHKNNKIGYLSVHITVCDFNLAVYIVLDLFHNIYHSAFTNIRYRDILHSFLYYHNKGIVDWEAICNLLNTILNTCNVVHLYTVVSEKIKVGVLSQRLMYTCNIPDFG